MLVIVTDCKNCPKSLPFPVSTLLFHVTLQCSSAIRWGSVMGLTLGQQSLGEHDTSRSLKGASMIGVAGSCPLPPPQEHAQDGLLADERQVEQSRAQSLRSL